MNPLRRFGHFVATVFRRFDADDCLSRAASLAYTSLLSLVPLLAVMFAVLKGLGVQRRLEPLLLSRLSLDPTTTESIIGYIDQTNVGTIGTLGAVLLLLTVRAVLGSVEWSFNYIWRVERGRDLWRQATDYLGVLLLTPFLLLAGVALTSSMQFQGVLDWLMQLRFVGDAMVQALALMPIAFNALALGMLYSVMPNRRPYAPAILLGALFAGTGWYFVQLIYIKLQIGVANYSAIYGALAQLPVTLVWLDVSWMVVLLGAELAAVFEFGINYDAGPGSRINPIAMALQILLAAAKSFREGGPPVEVRFLARQLRVPGDEVEMIVRQLLQRGWVARPEAPRPSVVLARSPEAIRLGDMATLPAVGLVPRGLDARVERAMQAVAQTSQASWNRWSLADVIEGRFENRESGTGEQNWTV